MKIQEQDVFHGPALAQIVEFPAFKALNKVDQKYGHYVVNTNRRLVMKYAKTPSPWKFSFSVDDLRVLGRDIDLRDARTFVVLVCKHETICVLTQDQLMSVVDIYDPRAQAITVSFPDGGGLRVEGTLGKLAEVVPHNAFPGVIFQ